MERYDIGDQNLKLIDISSEDDFLIDPPLIDSLEDLRLSVTLDNMNENGEGSNLSRTSAKIDDSTQMNEQNELKHLSSAPIQPGRPSYLRKSSAWDNAFFTSAGLLDPHELSSMNKELDTLEDHLLPVILEDVCAWKPDLQSIPNIRTGPKDMIYRSLVFKRKNINDARPKRSKTQQLCKRRECNSQKLKLPIVPWPRTSASTWQGNISSRDMYSVDIEGKKKTGPGRDLMVSNPTTHSSIKEKQGEARKTKHSASVSSTKTPIRSSTKSKKFENLSSSMEINHSSHKSPHSTTNARSLESSSSTTSTNRAHNDSKHRLLEPRSQLTGPVPSVTRENPQPSGLCMPSPKFGFFDEDVSVERTFDGNSNQPQKQGMSASIDKGKSVEASIKVKQAKRPLSNDSVNRDSMQTIRLLSPIKSGHVASKLKAKNASYIASDARKDGFDVQSKYQTGKYREIARVLSSMMRNFAAEEHDRKRVTTPQSPTSRARLYESLLIMSLNSIPSRDKEITSTSKSRKQENEVIDLNDGTETQLKQRIPLVEKNSVCNTSVALMRSDMVKDKESSNLLASKGTDKENN